MSNFSISNNRQWYDIVQDGNGGESNRIQGSIAPFVSVNTSIDGNSRNVLSIFYYDSISGFIRRSFDRSPDMEFQNLSNVSTLSGFNNLVGYTERLNYSNNHYYYTDNEFLYSSLNNLPLTTFNSDTSNIQLKKYISSTNSYFVLAVGSNLYSISGDSTILYNQLANDYDGRDFYPYIDDKTQITYLAYTNINGVQVLTPYTGSVVTTHGTIVYTSAKLGNSAVFNNTVSSMASNYILIGNKVTNPFSISIWFNTTDGVNLQTIFGLTDSNLNSKLDINFHNPNASNGLVLNITGTSGYVNIISTTQVAANTWYHVCITIDSSYNTILYVNGVNVGTVVSSALSNITNIFIGGSGNGASSFAGYIDELNFFNRVITSSEVTTLYGLGSVSSGLIGHYAFDTPFSNLYAPTVTSVTGNISVTSSVKNNSGIFNNPVGATATNYLTVTNSINLPISTAFWFYPLDTSNIQVILSLGNKDNNTSIDISIANNILGMNIQNVVGIQSNVTINSNNWYSVFASITSSTIDLYVNGINNNTTSSISSLNYTDQFVIGCNNNGLGYGFNGYIDELYVFNNFNVTNVNSFNSNVTIVDNTGQSLYLPFDVPISKSNPSINYNIVGTISTSSAVIGNCAYFNNEVNTAGDIPPSIYNKIPFNQPPPLSISFWFNCTDVTKYQCVFSLGNNSYILNYDIYTSLIALNGIGGTAIPISSNTWNHIVLTMDSSYNFKIYLNNTLRQSSNGSLTGYTQILLGSSGGLERGYNGYIDEFIVYNRVISASEVSSLYNIKGSSVSNSLNAVPGGAIIYMPLDGNTRTSEFCVASGYGAGACLKYSYDGVMWFNGNNIFDSGQAYGIAYGGDMWVAVGQGSDNTIGYSLDGINWVGCGVILTVAGLCVAFNNQIWIAGGNGGINNLAYSYDGVNWNSLKSEIFLNATIRCVAYSGTYWLAAGTSASGQALMISSIDGLNWTLVNVNNIFTTGIYTLCWNGSKWIAGGVGSSSLGWSSDGITWYPTVNNLINIAVYSICWNGSLWVASGNGAGTNTFVAYSTDGLTWTGSSNLFPSLGWPESITWNGCVFTAVTAGGYMVYSIDGSIWLFGNNGLNTFINNGSFIASSILLPITKPRSTNTLNITNGYQYGTIIEKRNVYSGVTGGSTLFVNTVGEIVPTNYITISNEQSLPITVSVWFKSNDGDNYQTILSFTEPSFTVVNASLIIDYLATSKQVGVYGALPTQWTGITSATNTVLPNTWNHVAFTLDTSYNLVCYLNGIQFGLVTGTGSISNYSIIMLGGFAGLRGFNGNMSEFMVYNSVLTSSQIYDLFKLKTNLSGRIIYLPLNEPISNTPIVPVTTGTTTGTITYTSAVNRNSGFFNNVMGNSIAPTCYMTVPFTQPSPITISHWFNCTDVTQFNCPIGIIGLNNNSSLLYINFDIYNSSINYPTGTYTIISKTWYHFCYTVNANNFKFYINGKLIGSGDAGYTLASSTQIIIGGAADMGRGFNGYIDDVAAYNRILTANEVISLYNLQSVTNGRIVYLPFDAPYVAPLVPTVVGSVNYTTSVKGNSAFFNNATLGDSGDATNYLLIPFTKSNPFSVSFWFNCNDVTQVECIVSLNSNLTGEIINFHIIYSNIYMYINGAQCGSLAISSGQWYHVCLTLDKSYNQNFYVNGTLVGATTGTAILNSSAFILGAHSSLHRAYNGSIDEFIVYNRVLSSSEVTSLYNSKNITDSVVVYAPLDKSNYVATPIMNNTFNPTSIPGLKNWYDASDPLGNGITPAIGTTITTWYDKSGNQNNTTGGNNNATFQNDGYSYLSFNNSYYSIPSISWIVNSTFTFFFVETLQQSTGDNYIFGCDYTGDPDFGLHITYRGSVMHYAFYGDDLDGSVPAPPTGVTRLWSFTLYANKARAMYLNGSLLTSDTAGNYLQSAVNACIGRGLNQATYTGGFREVMLFGGIMSSTDREKIEGYLAWKWGLKTQLPTNHTYYNNPPTSGPKILLKAKDYSGIGAWLDESGNGFNATLYEGLIAKNKDGNGIILNGSTCWTFPNVAVGNSWTAGVWYKNTGDQIGALGGAGACILSQIYTGLINIVIGDINVNNNRTYNCGFMDGPWREGTNFTLITGSWTNIQATWDGTNLNTYINGVLLGSVQPGGTGTDSGLAYRIGRRWDYSEYMVGEIGEVRIYNYPLNQAQVTADYNSSVATFIPPSLFLPTNISGLTQWFDANDPLGNGTIPSNGSTITVWNDKSGNGYNLAQNGSYPLPTISTNSINSLPSINFTNSSGLVSSSFAKSNNVTMLIVCNVSNSAQIASTFWGHYSDHDGDIQLRNWNNIMTWHTNNNNTTGPTITFNTPVLYSCTMASGTNMFIQQTNSTGTTSQTFTESLTWTSGNAPVYVGMEDNANFSNSKIYEILYYQRVLSESERQYIEGYLANKWSLKSQLPLSHPFKFNIPTLPNSLITTQWNPTQILGLQVWLDGKDPFANGGKLVPTSGTVISTWFDKSNNGYNATGNGGATINANNQITFNGTSQYFSTSYTSQPAVESIFVVYSVNALGQYGLVDTTDQNGRSYQSLPTNGPSLANSGNTWVAYGSITPTNGVTYIAECLYNTSGINLYVTGTSSLTNNVNPAFSAGTTLIGAGYAGTGPGSISWYLNGTISEIIIYNSLLSNSDRLAVEGYLANKWGLDYNLPAGQPYKLSPPLYISNTDNNVSNMFVAVGTNQEGSYTTVAYSSDGITWNASSSGTALLSTAYCVTYASDLWLAGGNCLAYSNDGMSWTISSITSGNIYGIIYAGNKWIVSVNGTLFSSIDGINWSLFYNTMNIYNLYYVNNVIYGILNGSNYALYYSIDGLTWTSTGLSYINTISYNGKQWLAGSSNAVATYPIYYSNDGINWIGSASSKNVFQGMYVGPSGPFIVIYQIAWNGNIWVAATMSTAVVGYSFDGITWTSANCEQYNNEFTGVAWNGTRFVTVSRKNIVGGATNTTNVLYSSNGISWTVSTSGSAILMDRVSAVAAIPPIINVNTNPNIPEQIPGLFNWLDTSDISTLFTDSSKTTPVVNLGDSVGCIVDKVGIANVSSQVYGFTWTSSNVTTTPNSVTNISTSGLWDAYAFSSLTTNNGASVSFTANSTTGDFVVGFAYGTSATPIYSNFAYGLRCQPNGTLQYILNGAFIDFDSIPSYTTSNKFKLVYNGNSGNVKYYVDGTLILTLSAVANDVFYLYIALGLQNSQVNNILFSGGNIPTYNPQLLNLKPGVNFSNSCRLMSANVPKSSNVTLFWVGTVTNNIGDWGTLWGHFLMGRHDSDIMIRQSFSSGSMMWHTNNDNNNMNIPIVFNQPVIYWATMENGINMNFTMITNAGVYKNISTIEALTWAVGNAPIYVGSSDYYESSNSFMSEILYYQRVLSQTEINTIVSYLGTKWGIKTVIPTAPIENTNTLWLPNKDSKLGLWLDAGDYSTSNISNSTAITNIVDKIGSVNFTPQGSYTSNLTLSTGNINTLPSMYFNNIGGDDVYMTGAYNFNNSGSLLFVANIISTTNTNEAIISWGADLNIGFLNNNNTLSVYGAAKIAGAYLDITFGTPIIVYADWNLSSQSNIGNVSLSVNGNNLITNSLNSAFSSQSTLTIGKDSHNIPMNFGELLVYSEIISNDARQKAEGYLANKWSLSDNLPDTHPFANVAPSITNIVYPIVYTKPNSFNGLLVWLDGADPYGSGTIPPIGTSINKWYDKSGNNNNYIQSNKNYIPIFGYDKYYNKNGIIFNGNQYYIQEGGSYLDGFNKYTIITAHRFDSTIGNPAELYRGGNGTNNIWFRYYAGGINVSTIDNTDLFYTTSIPNASGIGSVISDSTLNAYMNGKKIITGYKGLMTESGNTIINIGTAGGGGENFTGSIFEFLVFNYAMNDTERQLVEAYLANKWNLGSKLPINHQYNIIDNPKLLKTGNIILSGSYGSNSNSTVITNTNGVFSSNYLKIPNNTNIPLSINFWMNSTDVISSQSVVGLSNATFDTSGLNIDIIGGKLIANICLANVSYPSISTTITSNEWHNVGLNIDNNYNGTLYLDGTKVGSTWAGSGQANITNYTQFILGGPSDNSSRSYTGSLQNFNVYNRILLDNEMKSLYNNIGVTDGLIIQQSLGNVNIANITNVGTIINSGVSGGSGLFVNTPGENQVPTNYITVPNDQNTTLPITVSVWFNSNDSSNYQTILSFTEPTFNVSLLSLGIDYDPVNKRIGFVAALPTQWNSVQSPNNSALPNIWNHVAVTIDTSYNFICYLNGISVGSTTGTGTISSYSLFLLGAAGHFRGFNGYLENFLVYNRVLTGGEISSLYNLNSISNGLIINLPLTSDPAIITNTEATATTVGALQYVGGLVGNCAYFTNSPGTQTQYITVPNTQNLPITISFWMNCTDTSTSTYQTVMAMGNTSFSSGSMNFDIYNNTLGITFSFTDHPVVSYTISSNTWYHVCLTIDSTYTGILYINGVYIGTNHSNDTSILNNQQLIFGGQCDGFTRGFNGYIEEVRIYNRVLLAPEVLSLYQLKNITYGMITYLALNKSTIEITEVGSVPNNSPFPKKYRGDWSGSINYGLNDVVSYTGYLWILASTGGWTIGGAPPGYGWEILTNISGSTIFNNPSPGTPANTILTSYNIAGAISIAFWFYCFDVTENQTPVSLTDNSNTYIIDFNIGNVSGNFAFNTAIQGGLNNTNVPIISNKWYHICATIDSSSQYNQILYVNGTQINGVSGAPLPAYTRFRLGGCGNISKGYQGYLQNFVVYDRKITSAEVTSLYNMYVPPSGLVINLPLNQTAYGVANTMNETIVGSPTYTTAQIGNGINFTDGTSYITVPNTTNVPMSILFWFNDTGYSSAGAAGNILLSGDDFDVGFLVYLNGSSFDLWLQMPIQWNVHFSVSYNSGAWNHAAITIDSSFNVILYINGINVATGNGAANITNLTKFSFGSANTFSSYGSLDDFQVYNRSLAPFEINNIYQIGLGGKSFLANGIVTYLPFDSAPITQQTVGNVVYSGVNGGSAFFNNPPTGNTPTDANNYLTMTNSTNVPISISLWFNAISLGSINQSILSSNQNTGGISIILHSTSNLTVYCCLPTQWTAIELTLININTWNHICVTVDSSYNIIVYLNGINSGTGTGSANFINFDLLYLGGDTSGTNSGFIGYIENFMLYNRDLSESEVTSLYNLETITSGRIIYLHLDSSNFYMQQIKEQINLSAINPYYMNILATLTSNQYSIPRIVVHQGILYLFVVNTNDNYIYSTTINGTRNVTILNKFKEASDYKISIINNKIVITVVNQNGRLNRITVANNALKYNYFIKTNVPVKTFDICNMNDEEFIFYVSMDNLLHQVWNPALFINVQSQEIINNLVVTNTSESTTMSPSFSKSINDYYITSNTQNSLRNISIVITDMNGASSTILYEMYPGQCLDVYDSVNHYYIKLLPNNITIGTSITKNTGYIPGYYLNADTFGTGSNYYNIHDSNGVPVWYRRNNSVPNFNSNPQVCSLFLGMGKNRVITNIFDVNRTRTIVDVSTLIEENYKVITPDTRGNIVDWDVHEVLEIKDPLDRRGNIIFGSYVSGGFYFQEQNNNHQIVWEFWSSDLINAQGGDYFHFNSIDVHPINGDLIISFRNCSTIACINYETKNIEWAIDPTGDFAAVIKNTSLVNFLTATNEPIHGGNQYNGTSMQHDARWQYEIEPLTPGNNVISAYDDQSGTGWTARGVIYEIDLINSHAIHRGSAFAPSGGSSGYMGSYKIQREIDGTFSHVVDYVQQHNCLYEFADNGVGIPTGNILLTMDLPGDLYRICKARPADLDIEVMRKTSGMPISTLLDVGQFWNIPAATNVTVNSLTSVTKNVATNAYDTQIYSIISYIKPSFSIQLTTLTTGTVLGVFGLSENPSASVGYFNINYGWNFDLTNINAQIYESGIYINTPVSLITDVNSIYEINFDGVNINYLVDGVNVRSVARKNYNPLYCNLCIAAPNLTLNNIYFNPYN